MDSLQEKARKKKWDTVLVIRCFWARSIGSKRRSGEPGRFHFAAETSNCCQLISSGEPPFKDPNGPSEFWEEAHRPSPLAARPARTA